MGCEGQIGIDSPARTPPLSCLFALLLAVHAVCDPVQGDDGRLYVHRDMPAAFRDLIVPQVCGCELGASKSMLPDA